MVNSGFHRLIVDNRLQQECDGDLVGALEHDFYDFPFSWECHNPNRRTHIFQRGRYTTNQSWYSCFSSKNPSLTDIHFVSPWQCLVELEAPNSSPFMHLNGLQPLVSQSGTAEEAERRCREAAQRKGLDILNIWNPQPIFFWWIIYLYIWGSPKSWNRFIHKCHKWWWLTR